MEKNNWALIAKCVPNRTDVQCRERYWNILDPRINHSEWTLEEDGKLKTAYEKNPDKWSMIATSVGSRTDNQCRRRWNMLSGKRVKRARKTKTIKSKQAKETEEMKSLEKEEKKVSVKEKEITKNNIKSTKKKELKAKERKPKKTVKKRDLKENLKSSEEKDEISLNLNISHSNNKVEKFQVSS